MAGSSVGVIAGAAAHRLAFDVLTPNLSSRHLADRNGTEVPLTTGELDLLHALLARPLQVQTRDQLMNSLHGRDAGPFGRAIDVQVGRLRRKIEAEPAGPRLIRSVRGSGQVFAVVVGRS